MIAKIKGTLSEIEGNLGLIETLGGITYQVFLTPSLINSHLPGSQVDIYTYLQIRDDAHVLFGFQNKNQKKYFELLLGISGVGPKTAYTIISFSSEDEMIKAVRDNDVDYFSRVPGLGKKTAMKIILEISQKLKSEFDMDKMYISEDDKTVVDALVSLGFKTPEARKILSQLPKDLSIEEKISQGIKLATNP